MTGYVRVDTSNNISDGNVIAAADLDNEFDGVQAAFNATTGHTHGGGVGEGAPITKLGPTNDVTVSASLLAPKTTNTVDIGSSSLKYKDLYLAGNASIGGTLAVTGATTLSAALTYGGVTLSNAVTGTGNMVLSNSPTLTGTLSGANASLSGTLAVTGVATLTAQPILSSLTASRAVFTDGSKGLVSNAITGTGNVVMSASPTLTGTITAEALTTSSTVTLSGGTANGVAYLNGSKALTTGSALTFDGNTFTVGAGAQTGYRLQSYVTSGNDGISILNGSNGAGDFAALSFVQAGNQKAVLYTNSENFTAIAQGGAFVFGASGSEQMRLTSTGLGIGTSSPGAKLHAVGAILSSGALGALSASNIFVDQPTSALSRIGVVGANTSTFGTLSISQYSSNGSLGRDALTLDSSGNLGLGVAPSAWSGSGKALQLPFEVALSSYGLLRNVYYDGASYRYITSGHANQYAQNNGAHVWYTAPSGTAGNAISFTQAMTLDAAGDLMVGTTSSLGRFTLIGSAASSKNLVLDSNASYGEIQTYSAPLYLNRQGNNVITNSGGGSFLVGTTNTTGMVTGNSVNQGFAAESGGTFYNQQNAGPNLYMSKAAGFTVGTFQAYYTAGTERGSISYNGSVIVYATTSDYRLKTLVSPIANAGSRIDALNPVEYTWNENNKTDRGFFAHEFQSVYPNSVNGTKDAVDAEGKPIYQSMQASSSEVIADLVAELKSLRARVQALESN